MNVAAEGRLEGSYGNIKLVEFAALLTRSFLQRQIHQSFSLIYVSGYHSFLGLNSWSAFKNIVFVHLFK